MRLDRAALSRIGVTPYDLLRSQLRTGDVVFAAGDYAFSRLISWATGSPISHTGVVVRVDEIDRVLLLEAVENFGVRLAPLSMMRSYRGMVFVARTQGTLGDVVTASAWGCDELAKPYSYATIARLAWRIVRSRGSGDDPDVTGYVCSEFAARWLHFAGVAALAPRGTELVTPAELWEHPSLSLLGRIR